VRSLIHETALLAPEDLDRLSFLRAVREHHRKLPVKAAISTLVERKPHPCNSARDSTAASSSSAGWINPADSGQVNRPSRS